MITTTSIETELLKTTEKYNKDKNSVLNLENQHKEQDIERKGKLLERKGYRK